MNTFLVLAAESAHAPFPVGLVLGIVAVGLVVAGVWLWSLIHCIMNKRLNSTNRTIGVILIVILGLLGSLIYLFLPREPVSYRRGLDRQRGFDRPRSGVRRHVRPQARPGDVRERY